MTFGVSTSQKTKQTKNSNIFLETDFSAFSAKNFCQNS